MTDKMSRYFAVLVSFGMLSPLLLAAGEIRCSEPETVLRQIPSVATQLTECLLECTGMTHIKKLQLQDNRNMQLKDSTEGDLGEYCWSTKLRCTVGESLHHAYVVVPVDVSAVRHEMLEVRTTGPAASTLQPHNSPSTIDDSCGLRYDVTQHFTTANAGTSFCLQVITKDNVLGDNVLRCPPHLVTIWQKNQPSSAGGE